MVLDLKTVFLPSKKFQPNGLRHRSAGIDARLTLHLVNFNPSNGMT
jgi:hypothetical protein